MKYRAPSLFQKLLVALLWALAIGAVVIIGQSVSPLAQNSTSFQLKMYSPIIAALTLTILILISPSGPVKNYDTGLQKHDDKPEIDLLSGRSLVWKLKTVAMVLLGMIWVCAVAPFFMATLFSYELVVLKPVCSQFAKDSPQAVGFALVSGARFRPNLNQYWSDEYRSIKCEFGEGTKTIELNKLAGKSWEFVINLVSGLLVLIITLGLWYYATYRLVKPTLPKLKRHFRRVVLLRDCP